MARGVETVADEPFLSFSFFFFFYTACLLYVSARTTICIAGESPAALSYNSFHLTSIHRLIPKMAIHVQSEKEDPSSSSSSEPTDLPSDTSPAVPVYGENTKVGYFN